MQPPTARFIIGIAGPTCSGKTALAMVLARRFADRSPVVVPMDMYYKDLSHLPDHERARQNFDSPEALDWDLLRRHVRALARGKAIDMPRYDFTTHCRQGGFREVTPANMVIVEGLLALHDSAIRAEYGASLFVTLNDEACLSRRERRDVAERGRTPESVRAQFRDTVDPMAKRYVLPTRRFADRVISGAGSQEETLAQAAAFLTGRLGGQGS